MRKAAVEAIVQIESARALEALIEASKDADKGVHDTAKEALGRIQNKI